jgi:hypothetical protein
VTRLLCKSLSRRPISGQISQACDVHRQDGCGQHPRMLFSTMADSWPWPYHWYCLPCLTIETIENWNGRYYVLSDLVEFLAVNKDSVAWLSRQIPSLGVLLLARTAESWRGDLAARNLPLCTTYICCSYVVRFQNTIWWAVCWDICHNNQGLDPVVSNN